jgi:hypothetical protein
MMHHFSTILMIKILAGNQHGGGDWGGGGALYVEIDLASTGLVSCAIYVASEKKIQCTWCGRETY